MGLAAASSAPPQPQFGRFRVHDFQRTPVTRNGRAPAGQCSRFRVSDFVPYGSTTGSVVNGGASAPGSGGNVNVNVNGSAGVTSPTTAVEGGQSEVAQVSFGCDERRGGDVGLDGWGDGWMDGDLSRIRGFSTETYNTYNNLSLSRISKSHHYYRKIYPRR